MPRASGDILVLDCGESDKRVVQTIAKQNLYNPIITTNALEALKFLHKRDFSLIITCMGSNSKWNMISTIRSASKKAPILTIIPVNSEINPNQLLKAGVWKILMDTFEEEELLSILKNLQP